MVSKRKSATSRQNDGPPKKKIQIAVTDDSNSNRKPSIITDDLLPSRISGTKPLPTMHTASNLPPDALQSIAESGVLAASIDRSRTKWISEGLFEKYWTKPTKKKSQPEPTSNPGKETMQRLGPCRVFVDPHTFDATLYAIREPPATAKAPKQAKAQQAIFTVNQAQPPQNGGAASNHTNRPAVTRPPTGNTPATAPAPKTAQDPVIQMLAQRASQDTQLKNLMQVVAAGHATPAQLHIFQTHINQLNVVLQQQQSSNQSSSAAPGASSSTSQQPKPATPASAPIASGQPLVAPAHPPIQAPLPANITGVALEFTAGNGDRYLLPRMSIFEYDVARRQVVLSFLVVRKGSDIPLLSGTGDTSSPATSRYKPNTEYHQPVTIRLASDQPRIWDPLAKSLPSIQEVQRYMEDVIARTERVEEGELALRLPFKGLDLSDESSVPSTPSGKTPTGPKAADRKHSLIKQAAAGAAAAGGSPRDSPGRNTKAEGSQFEEQHCMYCFEEVYAPVQKLEGKTVCPTCAVLRRKDMKGLPVRRPDTGPRLVSAPRALVI